MYALYTAVALIGLVTLWVPLALVRRFTRGVPLNARARLGGAAPIGAGRPSAWLHAVSVGEAIATAPLIEGLRRLHPELPVVMTTVTNTGAQIVRERFAGLVTHRFFPLDLPWVARRVATSINPAFLICMETELWPNTLRALASRGVPVMIANGRISDRSFRRYRLVLVIAPRHPERTAEVLALLARRGWPSVRRSELPFAVTSTSIPVPPIIVLDSVGELATLYAIADVVFVGGSLVPVGGHNLLEAAQRRRPVLVGPHTGNFRESASLLESAGAALVVRDASELARELRRLLADPDLRAKLGNAGYEAVASRHGAVRETLDLIGRYLYPGVRS